MKRNISPAKLYTNKNLHSQIYFAAKSSFILPKGNPPLTEYFVFQNHYHIFFSKITVFNIADGKDVNGKGAYVNIQTNTDSIVTLTLCFKKWLINNKSKILEIVIEDPSSPIKRQNTYYVQMSLFGTFYSPSSPEQF